MSFILLARFVSDLKLMSLRRCVFLKVKKSKFILLILDVLYRNGCIRFYKILKLGKILIMLKYISNKKIFFDIKLISKASSRKYIKLNNILVNNYKLVGFFIISTSKGIFTSNELLLLNNLHFGGELLFFVKL